MDYPVLKKNFENHRFHASYFETKEVYQIMQENRRRVDEERQELQTLVSDISHQDSKKTTK